MGGQPDNQRLIGDLLRIGTVEKLDLSSATCRVRIGEIVTGDLPWLSARAGAVRIWSPPSVGEQVLLLCPEGDAAAGLILPSLFSDAHPAPAASADSWSMHFEDGTWLGYDPASAALTAIVAGGGTAHIEAPAGITIRGDVTITGKLVASDDVVAGDVSLKAHRHDKVQAGGAISGTPVA